MANEVRLDDMKYVAGFYDLVERVHSHGTKIFAQIHQCGNQTTLDHSEGVELISPSGVPCPVCQTQPRPLTIPEIQELVKSYANGAKWAQVAGCDGVEIHGAHGYIIQQFMSPSTNKRVDEYGGTLERRMRFPLEIVKGIREVCGDSFIIDFRMSVDELIDGGYHLDEGLVMVKMLEEAGIDMIHASGGCYGAMAKTFETQGFEQGARLYIAEAVKKVVNIPVIAIGNLRTPDICEDAINTGKTDLVALGRTLIADPDWPNKAKAGKADEIRKCISCLYCLGGQVHPGKRMRCTVNPYCGLENLCGNIKETESSKKVMIIGGGPAGCMAAISATKKGHDVTLYEKNNRLGGQLNLASVPPDKDVINWVGEWQEGEISRLNIKVKVDTDVTPELISAEQPDHVILASGSLPFIPNIRGVEQTISSWDVLEHRIDIKENNIIIMGGGIVGAETAHMLAKEGKNITIIDMLPEIAMGLERTTRGDFMEKLDALHVKQIVNAVVTEISEDGVHYFTKHSGRKGFVKGDKVILSIGQSPVQNLKSYLQEIDVPYTIIGDADCVSTIAQANRSGYDAGMHIE